MLVTFDGIPIPSAEVVQRLKEIDEALDLKWFGPTDRWALTFKWRSEDPRWERVQKGEIGPQEAYDIFTFIPKDCPADQAYAWAVRSLERKSSRQDVQRLLDKVRKANAQQRQENLESTMALCEELVATNAPTLFRDMGKTVSKVYQYNPQSGKLKPKVIDG